MGKLSSIQATKNDQQTDRKIEGQTRHIQQTAQIRQPGQTEHSASDWPASMDSGLPNRSSVWFIADANVLIDYVSTSPQVLSLVAKHIGPVCVEATIVDEVAQLDEKNCEAIGLRIVQATVQQLSEASTRGGALSFEDKLCLVLARDYGWRCLTNDRPLRAACHERGIKVVWGLELMFGLVKEGHMSVDKAVEVARQIHAVNPIYITSRIVDMFQQKLQEMRV